MATRPGGDQVQSLVRALRLLNRLAEGPDTGATLTELAGAAGLASSTAHRLLTTLEQERFVRFDGDGRLWSVGVQAFVSGCAFTRTRNLVALARPHMRRLMEQGGETVNLAVEDDGTAVYLAQVECRQMMRAFARPGSRVPLHCSAVGKAILSGMDDTRLARALDRHGMPRLTRRTLTTPEALRTDLEHGREAGHMMDDEEQAVGLRCIGAPVFDETGDVVGAVSASGPVARLDAARTGRLAALVRAAAAAVTAEMGGVTRGASPDPAGNRA